MHVLTESEVRNLSRRIPAGGRLAVPSGSIVTPLARDYLRARNIEISEETSTAVREVAPSAQAAPASAEDALIDAVASEVARLLRSDAAPEIALPPERGRPERSERGVRPDAPPVMPSIPHRTPLTHPAPVANSPRAVVWAIGGDRPGLLAAVAELLGRHKINILEISQTILSGVFAMVVIVDVANSSTPFGDLKRELEELGKKLQINISAQRDEIFQYMHRI